MKIKNSFTNKEYTCRDCGKTQKFKGLSHITHPKSSKSIISQIIQCPSCGWKWWIFIAEKDVPPSLIKRLPRFNDDYKNIYRLATGSYKIRIIHKQKIFYAQVFKKLSDAMINRDKKVRELELYIKREKIYENFLKNNRSVT